MTATTYTVVITDKIFGCQNTAQITIDDSTVPVPLPEFENIAHRINCVVPNGSASVSINGETSGYLFEWYSADDPSTILFTGPSGAGLDAGNYVVIAEDLITGCRSDESPLEILDETRPPSFTVESIPSVCSLDNGGATLVFDNITEIDSIAWDLGNGDIRYDFQLSNATDGQGYSVFVRDKNQCTFETTFDITTDIIVYNGVSDNSDGMNDWFIIDCIDRFEFNRVQIFNRAGQLVWETDENGYINGDDRNSFRGIANKGVSFGSERLPEGTYYYIIERNIADAGEDDILQGFLELVR